MGTHLGGGYISLAKQFLDITQIRAILMHQCRGAVTKQLTDLWRLDTRSVDTA